MQRRVEDSRRTQKRRPREAGGRVHTPSRVPHSSASLLNTPHIPQALVWHLVGTGGGYESRKKVMRAWGAWHYPLVDSLPDPLHFFPMDNSRVLAFDQRAAAALSFASVENLVTAVRVPRDQRRWRNKPFGEVESWPRETRVG